MAGRAKSGSGAETQQLPAPQSGLFSKGKKRAGAGQVRGLQGSSPGRLHACTPGRSARSAPRPPQPAGPLLRGAQTFPRGPFSRGAWVAFAFFFFFLNCFETAIEIKRPLGAIETAGRLCSCNPWSTSSGWGRAAGAELERAARPAAAEDRLRGGREPNIYVIFLKI